MRRPLTAVLSLVMTSAAAFGGDAEFDRVVRAIESHYGARPTHFPFMGLADFLVKVAHPEGVSGFKLALFENLNSASDPAEWRERDRFMDTLPGSTLHPLVRVHSRRDGEATYIFVDPASRSARVLIATFERHEATVIEVKANVEALLKSLEDPEHAGRKLRGDL